MTCRHREGSSTLQTLAMLLPVIIAICLAVQMAVFFLHGILVNHALHIASQDAAAQGVLTDQAKQRFYDHLPFDIRAQCTGGFGPIGGCLRASAELGAVQAGSENTRQFCPFWIEARWDENLWVLKAFGVNYTKHMYQNYYVTSHSLKDAGTCP